MILKPVLLSTSTGKLVDPSSWRKLTGSHGLSTRLTGGPANSGCLGFGEAGGMGEGWGDAIATLIRQIEEHHQFKYAPPPLSGSILTTGTGPTSTPWVHGLPTTSEESETSHTLPTPLSTPPHTRPSISPGTGEYTPLEKYGLNSYSQCLKTSFPNTGSPRPSSHLPTYRSQTTTTPTLSIRLSQPPSCPSMEIPSLSSSLWME